jgi:hypothetical protein
MGFKKTTWTKEAHERAWNRLKETMKGDSFDANANKKKNLAKIKDDFPRY